MALEEYQKKRNFGSTKEPKGKMAKTNKKLIFVVQRHAASHLHYDFRLEMDGVLKSWAIPKGPSMNPVDKRLAVMVEDHPFSYRNFEGEIPKGSYGAGEVEIWDKGTYEPIEKNPSDADNDAMLQQLQDNSLKFILHGKKLKGEFTLFKMKHAKEENSWLLIKHKDQFAVSTYYTAEDYVNQHSVVSQYLSLKKKKSLK